MGWERGDKGSNTNSESQLHVFIKCAQVAVVESSHHQKKCITLVAYI